MSRVNTSGNRRGLSPGSKEGLKKGRQSRKKGMHYKENEKNSRPPVEHRDTGTALQFTNLIKGSVSQLHTRIRKYVKLCDTEPGVVTATLLGTLLADLESANEVNGKCWDWLNQQLENGGDPREYLKLMAELRKWTESLQNAAIQVAEIRRKAMSSAPPPPDAGITKYALPADAATKETKKADADGAIPAAVTIIGETES